MYYKLPIAFCDSQLAQLYSRSSKIILDDIIPNNLTKTHIKLFPKTKNTGQVSIENSHFVRHMSIRRRSPFSEKQSLQIAFQIGIGKSLG
jgi:hypothetical protein